MQRSIPRFLSHATLGLGALLWSGCASLDGVDPFETLQRSTLFVGTDTAPAEVLELEVGTVLDPDDSHELVVTATYGWSERTELFAEVVPYASVQRPGRDAHGFGDLVLGATSRFRDDTAGGPALALQASTKLPIGTTDVDLSSGETDFAIGFIAAEPLRTGVLSATLDLEALGEEGRAGTGVDLAVSGGLHLARTLRERVVAFASLTGSVAPERDEDDASALVGLAIALSETAVLDLGVSGGFGDDSGLELAWGVIVSLP